MSKTAKKIITHEMSRAAAAADMCARAERIAASITTLHRGRYRQQLLPRRRIGDASREHL